MYPYSGRIINPNLGRIDKQRSWLQTVGVRVFPTKDHDGALEYLSVTI